MKREDIARVADRVINDIARKGGTAAPVIHHRKVDGSTFEPRRNVLHGGNVIELSDDKGAVTRSPGEEAELRSALVALSQMQLTSAPKLKLNAKERIYLELLCEGHTDFDAARHFSVSVRAVKARKRKICEKNGSATINQVIAKFVALREHGGDSVSQPGGNSDA